MPTARASLLRLEPCVSDGMRVTSAASPTTEPQVWGQGNEQSFMLAGAGALSIGARVVTVSSEDINQCIRILEALVEDRSGLASVDLQTRNRLVMAAGRVSRPERAELKALSRTLIKQRRRDTRAADDALLARAEIRQLRSRPVFVTPRPAQELLAPPPPALPTEKPPPRVLRTEKICYVCKEPYRELHPFYDQLCPKCGEFNYAKRTPVCDLRGRTAYISGARVKIGYQAAIMLLRAGARVIVSTRFPRDAAQRYARETDFEDWAHRLQIHGLDLRHTPSVEAFARHIRETEPRLDFVIHNACQTVRRPVGFYGHLVENERCSSATLPAAIRGVLAGSCAASGALDPVRAREELVLAADTLPGVANAPQLSQVKLIEEDHETGSHIFPEHRLDADLQQVDLRLINSWRLPLDRVSTTELIEVQLVNSIAPFVLNARLKSLMLKTRTFDQHIVNVSAVEGQFYRSFKTDKHPHTNMAKAALNMMTRTSATDYVRDGIHMNSVDTGWVTDEDPAHVAERKARENGFSPPLDIVDGAARIVDPIFDGLGSGKHVWGQFLKDYRPAPW